MPAKELQFPAGYAWDPTGQKVVFTGHSANWRGGSNDPTVFYLFDTAAGGGARVIAKYKKTAVQDLSWSPDGQTIAFSEYDEDNYETGSIYQFSPSGGDAQLLIRGALFPAYQPAVGAPAP
jgi:Tol biopolymer transport system component